MELQDMQIDFPSQDDSQSQSQEQQKKCKTIKLTKKDRKKLSEKVQEFFNAFLKDNETGLQSYLKYVVKSGTISVCAKTVHRGSTIVECYDCRTDASCIICLECFQNGNHEGHKYVIKQAFGGCCDCGDPEAWKVEGFCKKHSGQIIDVEVDEKEERQFIKTFQQLFELYFDQLRSKNQSSLSLISKIIRYLIKLNKGSVYYNKMTTNLLTSKWLPLSQKVCQNSILGNLLKFTCTPTSNMINTLFLAMFPYYKFKQQLLAAYFQYYHLIYDGSQQSWNAGSALSCQILTSYQLVDDYIRRQGSIPIGQKVKIHKSVKKIVSLSVVILNNFDQICNLKGQTALHYFQRHVSYGLNSLFLFYAKVKESISKIDLQGQQNPQLYKMNTLISFVGVQHYSLEKLVHIISIIKDDHHTLCSLLKQIFQKATSQIQADTMTIFKPYERALSIALFAFLGMDLNNCTQKAKNLCDVLGITPEQLQIKFLTILKRMTKTFLYYCQVISSPGLSNTLQNYIHFYKQKSKLVMFLDIMLIKQIVLICNIEPIFNFDSIIQCQDKKKSLLIYLTTLQSFNLFYVSKIYEMYLAYALTGEGTPQYEKQLQKMFIKIMIQLKGNVSKTQIKQVQQSFFHESLNILDVCFKKLCKFDKQKKTFSLDQQYSKQIGLNFKNFRVGFEIKNLNPDLNKTSDLIEGYNIKLLQKIWCNQTTKKCIKIYHEIQSQLGEDQSFKEMLLQFRQIHHNLNKFQIDSSKIIEQHILSTTIAEKLLSSNQQQNKLDEEGQKKKKVRQIMQLKMNEIRLKQKKASMMMKNVKQHAQNDILLQPMLCSICKNSKRDRFVYLAYVKICNYEKIMKNLSNENGVQCISIASCYHAFDYQCIKKHMKQTNGSDFRCPVCRRYANCFLPYKYDSQLAKLSVKQIQFILKNETFGEVDVFQQILKSFYHYSLLSISDFTYTLRKRAKIYRGLFRVLKSVATQKILKKLKKKFQQKSFRTQIINQTKLSKKKPTNPYLRIIEMLIREQNEQIQGDEGQPMQIQQIQLLLNEQYVPPKSHIKQTHQEIMEQKEERGKEEIQNQFFNYTMSKLFQSLLKQEQQFVSESFKQKYEYNALKIALQHILDNQKQDDSETLAHRIQSDIQYLNKKFQYQNYIPMRSLPTCYSPLGKIVKCKLCDNVSPKLSICLFCEEWIGCFNCKEQTIFQHWVRKHGSNGLFFSIQKASVFTFIEGQQIELGVIYKDEYGNPFKISQNWDDFKLDQLFLKDLHEKIIHEQILKNE